jgi:hypothetical protein
MGGTPPSVHEVTGFFFKGKKKSLPWESMAAHKIGEGASDREQINCYL